MFEHERVLWTVTQKLGGVYVPGLQSSSTYQCFGDISSVAHVFASLIVGDPHSLLRRHLSWCIFDDKKSLVVPKCELTIM